MWRINEQWVERIPRHCDPPQRRMKKRDKDSRNPEVGRNLMDAASSLDAVSLSRVHAPLCSYLLHFSLYFLLHSALRASPAMWLKQSENWWKIPTGTLNIRHHHSGGSLEACRWKLVAWVPFEATQIHVARSDTYAGKHACFETVQTLKLPRVWWALEVPRVRFHWGNVLILITHLSKGDKRQIYWSKWGKSDISGSKMENLIIIFTF